METEGRMFRVILKILACAAVAFGLLLVVCAIGKR